MDRFEFRFWYFNKVEEKWKLWYCDLMSVDGTCLPFDNGEGGAYTDREYEFICEQCTGLKDKNGKLIYEGDLIKIDGDVAVIKWSDYYARFMLESQEDNFDFETTYAEECEIIGNIHNADLLEI